MKFTYDAYGELLELFLRNGFVFSGYADAQMYPRSCILRHDIDLSIAKALQMAEYEASLNFKVRSTFFVLLRTDFYNPASRDSVKMLREIAAMGHEIGLHFDESAYDDIDLNTCSQSVQGEADVLQGILGIPIRAVSMHMPSQCFLKSDLNFEGLINAYSKVFFKEFKYLSDSMRKWREDPVVAVESREYDRMHILTHPIWYDANEVSIQKILGNYMSYTSERRWHSLADDILDLDNQLRKV